MGDLKKNKLNHDYIYKLPDGEEVVIEHANSGMSRDEQMIARLRDTLEIFYRQQIDKNEKEKEEKKKVARYRTYRNGITGHRYKGYYIIKGEKKGLYQIWLKDKTVYKDHIYDYDECEWIIDKATMNDEEMVMIKKLYDMEIYQLSALLVELMQKKEREGLSPKNATLYKWVGKVRKRKAEEREF